MKLKKSLLALTTAATVAVAGTATAVADDNTTAGSVSAGQGTQNGEKKDENKKDDSGDKKDEGKSELAGSADKFFGWDENTSGLKKLTTVVTLITTIGSLVAGIIALANNFQKVPNLFK